MPASDKILWTCLPNGLNKAAAGGPKLRLTALVSPRLASSSLRIFTDWPAVVQSLQFSVNIANMTATVGAARVTLDSSVALDRTLWTKVFPSSSTPQTSQPATLVVPHSSAKTQAYRSAIDPNKFGGIQTYSVRTVASYIKSMHVGLSPAAPHQLPMAADKTLQKVKADLASIATNAGGARDTVFTRLRKARRTSKTGHNELDLDLPGLSDASVHFARQYMYRTRGKAPSTKPAPPPPAPATPNLDFHQKISILGDYPLILRRLGLVIDLEIPLTAAIPAESQLRLQVSGNSNLPQALSPWTAYILTDSSFTARPRSQPVTPGTGSLSGGVLDLGGVHDSHNTNAKNPFEIVQIDPDAAGAKLMNLSAALERGDLLGPIGQGTIGLPALRSAGLGLIKTDRASEVEDSINAAAADNQDDWNPSATGGQPFFAEDLLRGYRVDILDETQGTHWRSLCERTGSYALSDGTVLQNTPPDEGYVKVASVTSQYSSNPSDPNLANTLSNNPLYMHESVFRWTGWSLCVARPGKTVMDNGSAGGGETNTKNPLGIIVNFQARPGSLPRLRFGHSYRMRLRAVDLAGGGLSAADSPQSATISNSVVYSRFDPISPPVVVLTNDVGEGESLEHLVIRSNFNPTCDRHLAPPKTSLEMAEAHGALDTFIGKEASGQLCDQAYNIALREAGSLTDTSIVDTSTGVASVQIPGIRLEKAGAPGVAIDPQSQLSADTIAIHTEAQLRVPYLPDVIARGVMLAGVPGASSSMKLTGVGAQTVPGNVAQTWGGAVPQNPVDVVILKVPFAGTWPDVQPFRLRIAERLGSVPTLAPDAPASAYEEAFSDAGQPQWDPVNRVLTVFLGKGQTDTVTYSCYLNISDVLASQTPKPVPQLGYLRWWADPNDGGPVPSGPQVTALAQFTALGGNWHVTPYRQLVLTHAVQQPLFAPVIAPFLARPTGGPLREHQPQVAYALGNPSVSLSFGARFNSRTTGKLDLFAQWTEPVDDPAIAPQRPLDGSKQVFYSAHVAEIRPDPPPLTGPAPNSSTSLGLPHHFGDTKYRRVDYFLRATTAFRECFPGSLTADAGKISRDGPKHTINVLNRARPAAPRVLYVIPTLGWDPPRPLPALKPGGSLKSVRKGGGLRVYLDRPWYSSGDGELLGVVLRAGGTGLTSENDPMKHVITTWGRDVLRASQAPPHGPSTAHFAGFKQAGAGLRLDEQPPPSQAAVWTPVDVVGHSVQFDEERKLWYADILVDPGQSYFPFIRLALARFQPNSIAGAELSRVVLSDIMQLLPDRTLNINASADGKTVQVALQGVSRGGRAVDGALRNYCTAFIQEKSNNLEVVHGIVPVIPNTDIDSVWAQALSFEIVPPTFVRLEQNADNSTAVGTLSSPEAIGTGKYRLVVREYELFTSAADLMLPPVYPLDQPYRLVYMDIVDL